MPWIQPHVPQQTHHFKLYCSEEFSPTIDTLSVSVRGKPTNMLRPTNSISIREASTSSACCLFSHQELAALVAECCPTCLPYLRSHCAQTKQKAILLQVHVINLGVSVWLCIFHKLSVDIFPVTPFIKWFIDDVFPAVRKIGPWPSLPAAIAATTQHFLRSELSASPLTPYSALCKHAGIVGNTAICAQCKQLWKS